mgnify:CR=1 FL=1
MTHVDPHQEKGLVETVADHGIELLALEGVELIPLIEETLIPQRLNRFVCLLRVEFQTLYYRVRCKRLNLFYLRFGIH